MSLCKHMRKVDFKDTSNGVFAFYKCGLGHDKCYNDCRCDDFMNDEVYDVKLTKREIKLIKGCIKNELEHGVEFQFIREFLNIIDKLEEIVLKKTT